MGGLLTVLQAAEALALSIKTIYKLVARGEVQGLKLGRSVRVVKESVEAFLQRSTIRPADKPAGRMEKGETKPSPGSRHRKRAAEKGYRHVPPRRKR
jgi:excisionase family DNA binding protein